MLGCCNNYLILFGHILGDEIGSVKWFQEVRRIRNEHPDDPSAIVNDRVKGSLKVTRAFGAGFLKQVDCLHLD